MAFGISVRVCLPIKKPQLITLPQLFQNHEELLTGLAKTLTKVSSALPQIEIQLDLYSEPLMQLAAEKIYGSLIELFQEMVKFYEESPLKHAWKSFSAPLSVRFAPIIEAIDEQSRFMRDFASGLAKKEQRLMLKLLELIGKDVSVMAIDVSRLADAVVCEFVLFAVVTSRILLMVDDSYKICRYQHIDQGQRPAGRQDDIGNTFERF